MVEWLLVAAVLAVLITVLAREESALQGQSELAAIQSTLGSLRTALVIDHLHRTVRAGTGALAPAPQNPFDLLEHRPANYQGEMSEAQTSGALPGHWVFDPDCACVGYLPLFPQWFDSPSGGGMAWFKLTGAPGPLQLNARENYVWANAALH